MSFNNKARFSALAALATGLTMTAATPAVAGTDTYLGEVMMVGYTFCPRGYASAEGQLLPIAQNTALFSLLGTIYGGDGRTTFALPDLRGRTPVGQGTGPGLSPRSMGQRGGAETHTMTVAELPSHNHSVNANNLDGDKPGPGNKLLAAAPPGGSGSETIYSDQGPTTTMSAQMIANTGGSQAFNIMSPFLVMRYCVATQGIFPSRN